MVTRFQLHCERWKDGCGSAHCAAAQHRVLYRGKVPCDVLFVGEAPGDSEDCLGTPFEGPAGQKLDQIVERALTLAPARPDGGEWRVGFTNLVGCLPRDERGVDKARDGPDDEQVAACTPRLREIIRLADPVLLVLVGKQSQDWLTPGYKHSIPLHKPTKTVGIVHPAAVMRQNVANQSVAWQRCVVQVATAMADLTPPAPVPPEALVDLDDVPF